ncbi:MAG TPA: ferrous iron transport protein A [Coriobacteriia bacterium]|nr:ferrous iron transport protein A [Coriobacteriia bacterium]
MALTEVFDCDKYRIRRILGDSKVRHHLENLGFIPGEWVRIINHVDSGLIVNIKGCRVAVNHDAAAMILV